MVGKRKWFVWSYPAYLMNSKLISFIMFKWLGFPVLPTLSFVCLPINFWEALLDFEWSVSHLRIFLPLWGSSMGCFVILEHLWKPASKIAFNCAKIRPIAYKRNGDMTLLRLDYKNIYISFLCWVLSYCFEWSLASLVWLPFWWAALWPCSKELETPANSQQGLRPAHN